MSSDNHFPTADAVVFVASADKNDGTNVDVSDTKIPSVRNEKNDRNVKPKKPKKRRRNNNSEKGMNHPCIRTNRSNNEYYWDLQVCVPSTTTRKTSAIALPPKVMVQKLMERCQQIGYAGMALTHKCYGRPKLEYDTVDTTIQPYITYIGKNQNNNTNNNFRILKRINIIIENLSDVGFYASSYSINGTMMEQQSSSYTSGTNGSNTNNNDDVMSVHKIIQGYDIISVCPKNDIAFQAVCATSIHVDMITLEYTATASGLPYRMKLNDIKSAAAKNILFEIPYGSAIVNKQHRKLFLQTMYDIQAILAQCNNNSHTKTTTTTNNNNTYPRFIVTSSGTRSSVDDKDSDIGPIIIRSPNDIANICHTLLGMTTKLTNDMTRPGIYLLKNLYDRRRQNYCINGNKYQNKGIVVSDVHFETSSDKNSSNSNNNNEDERKLPKITVKSIQEQQKTNNKRNRKNTNMGPDNSVNKKPKKIDETISVTNTTTKRFNSNKSNGPDDDDIVVEDGFIAL